MAAVVMKCLDPETLEAWHTRCKELKAEFDAKCDAFKETIGGKELRGIQFYAGGFAVTGFAAGYRDELPTGWRREANSDNAVPAKRTPEGKEHAKTLHTLYLPDNDHPGVPKWLHCEGFTIYPQARKIGDDWWLTMGKEPYAKDMEGFDSDIWERAKLSEYHLALEAASEAAK